MSFRAASRITIAALLVLAAGGSAHAQQPASAAPTPAAPEVGTMAPDFALTGATRYGVLRDPVHLSDFRGKTVVLAFFYRARTKG
jgi:peroxiredoxin Q/BCP